MSLRSFRARRSAPIAAALLVLAAALPGAAILGAAIPAAHAAEAAARSYEVKIDNYVFGPATLTVPAGTTVTWTNQDDSPHTVTSADRRLKSPALDTGDRFSFTFDKPGSYSYFCSLHPHMTGTVVVLPAMRSSAR
jgi:plastocyanin